MKQGIVVVNHGTANHEIREKTIDEFILSIGDRLEDAEIVCAYTNSDVRKILREKSGEKIQNVKAAILGMKEKGVTHLIVVTTDILESLENKKLREDVSGLAGLFKEVQITKPLISSPMDADITARAFHGAFGEIAGENILVVIAENDKTVYDDPEYAEMFFGEEAFKSPMDSLEQSLRKYFPESHVASINGSKKLYKVIKELNGRDDMKPSDKKVILIPLEFIAGEDIENQVSVEFAGLISRLKDEGYQVEEYFKGLGEYDAFQRLFMKHLYEVIS